MGSCQDEADTGEGEEDSEDGEEGEDNGNAESANDEDNAQLIVVGSPDLLLVHLDTPIIYVTVSEDYEYKRVYPGEGSWERGIAKANDKFAEAGSSVRVMWLRDEGHMPIDSNDRVMTLVPSEPDNPVAQADTPMGGNTTIYAPMLTSDNRNTPLDEAAVALGNLIAHEAAHGYSVVFGSNEWYVKRVGMFGAPHPVHHRDPVMVMYPANDKYVDKQFSATAASQLPH